MLRAVVGVDAQTRNAVDQLADQIGVTGVTVGFGNHAYEHPAEAHGVGPRRPPGNDALGVELESVGGCVGMDPHSAIEIHDLSARLVGGGPHVGVGLGIVVEPWQGPGEGTSEDLAEVVEPTDHRCDRVDRMSRAVADSDVAWRRGDPMMIPAPSREPPQPLAVVCDRVTSTLIASLEFRALSVERQDRLARDMVAAAAAAARAIDAQQTGQERAAASTAPTLVGSVDFPTFVADLIKGTFDAIVDASIQQMEAYIELLGNVAKPAEDFMRDNDDAEHGGDNRRRCDGDDDGARLQLASNRQQALATMVLMGINRIVVTDGKISASTAFELRPRRRRG